MMSSTPWYERPPEQQIRAFADRTGWRVRVDEDEFGGRVTVTAGVGEDSVTAIEPFYNAGDAYTPALWALRLRAIEHAIRDRIGKR
jgi:hypothetical protein